MVQEEWLGRNPILTPEIEEKVADVAKGQGFRYWTGKATVGRFTLNVKNKQVDYVITAIRNDEIGFYVSGHIPLILLADVEKNKQIEIIDKCLTKGAMRLKTYLDENCKCGLYSDGNHNSGGCTVDHYPDLTVKE